MVEITDEPYVKPNMNDRILAGIAYFALLAGAPGIFFSCLMYESAKRYQKEHNMNKNAPPICKQFVIHHFGQAGWTGMILAIAYFLSGFSIASEIITIIKGLYIYAGISAIAGRYFYIPLAHELLKK